MGCEILPIAVLIIWDLNFLAIAFSLTHPKSPPLKAVSEMRNSLKWNDFALENEKVLFPLVEKIVGKTFYENLKPNQKLNIMTCKN